MDREVRHGDEGPVGREYTSVPSGTPSKEFPHPPSPLQSSPLVSRSRGSVDVGPTSLTGANSDRIEPDTIGVRGNVGPECSIKAET